MAQSYNRGRNISIAGLIAAALILYFLFHQGYLGRHDALTPPTSTPRLP